MRAIVVKCIRRVTEASVNGQITRVTVAPDGPLNTSSGELSFFVTYPDEDAYQVGKRFRLVPDPL